MHELPLMTWQPLNTGSSPNPSNPEASLTPLHKWHQTKCWLHSAYTGSLKAPMQGMAPSLANVRRKCKRLAAHRERGAVDAVGVHIDGGGRVLPLQEVHAARQVSADVVQQAQRVARAEVHVVYKHQPVRVPPRQLPVWPLQLRILDQSSLVR